MKQNKIKTRMWANVHRDGRPAEDRWRPLVQCRKVWLTPTTRVPCSNTAKTQNLLKFTGVPQTRQQISAVSSPKFTILWGRVEEVSVFYRFFRLSSCEDTAWQICAMVPKWGFFVSCISSELRAVQHLSDMHTKFALRPHHAWKYGKHPISDRWN